MNAGREPCDDPTENAGKIYDVPNRIINIREMEKARTRHKWGETNLKDLEFPR
jgi:hypothetical protein